MRRKNKLLVTVVGVVVLLGVLGATSMSASTEFVSPTQVTEGNYHGEWVNLEGAVQNLSTGSGTVRFDVSDGNRTVAVVYDGAMPDTMQEGRIVVAKGRYEGDRLVAKHLSVRAHEGTDRPDDA